MKWKKNKPSPHLTVPHSPQHPLICSLIGGRISHLLLPAFWYWHPACHCLESPPSYGGKCTGLRGWVLMLTWQPLNPFFRPLPQGIILKPVTKWSKWILLGFRPPNWDVLPIIQSNINAVEVITSREERIHPAALHISTQLPSKLAIGFRAAFRNERNSIFPTCV